MDVAETYVHERLQLVLNLRDIREDLDGLFDGGFEQIGDALALVFDLQRFEIVAAAATDVASDVDIGKEIHFDPLQPVTLAGFASAALHVKAESSGFVAALA